VCKRNKVTKHLAANTIEPKFTTPERQSKLDPFAQKLAGWLRTEAGKLRCGVCVNELRGNLDRRAFNASCPRDHRYLPKARRTPASFGICSVPIPTQRQNGAKLAVERDLLDEGQDSFLHYGQNMTVLARAIAERNTFWRLPYRVATRRQSMSRPNMISMRLRRL
jgi:hypothetical protein